MSDDDYQKAGAIRQALAERDNAAALGLTTRVEAATKQLESLGWSEEPTAVEDPPKGRAAPRKAKT